MRRLACLALLLAPATLSALQIERLEVRSDDGTYAVHLDAVIAAPPERVRARLTDYEGLRRLNPAILQSRLLVEDGRRIVHTRLRACVLFFCRDLDRYELLEEESADHIRTRLLPRGHFRSGEADWRLQAVPGGTRLTYDARMQPAFFIPPLIGPALVRARMDAELRHTLSLLERRCHEWP